MVSPQSINEFVRTRAAGRCEYCILPEFAVEEQFHLDHIQAQQHRGPTVPENLALACSKCNLYKGTNLAGIDPLTNSIVRLFHPRTDRWSDHFSWRYATLFGKTNIGRTTIVTLHINSPSYLMLRETLMIEGIFTIDEDS